MNSVIAVGVMLLFALQLATVVVVGIDTFTQDK